MVWRTLVGVPAVVTSVPNNGTRESRLYRWRQRSPNNKWQTLTWYLIVAYCPACMRWRETRHTWDGKSEVQSKNPYCYPIQRGVHPADQDKKPSALPFCFASRIRAWRILGPAPVKSQNAVMTWEWSAIALPLILFNCFSPRITLAIRTAGVKGPNWDFRPIVQFPAPVFDSCRLCAASEIPGRRTLTEPCPVRNMWWFTGRTGDARMKAHCILDVKVVAQTNWTGCLAVDLKIGSSTEMCPALQ